MPPASEARDALMRPTTPRAGPGVCLRIRSKLLQLVNDGVDVDLQLRPCKGFRELCLCFRRPRSQSVDSSHSVCKLQPLVTYEGINSPSRDNT